MRRVFRKNRDGRAKLCIFECPRSHARARAFQRLRIHSSTFALRLRSNSDRTRSVPADGVAFTGNSNWLERQLARKRAEALTIRQRECEPSFPAPFDRIS